MRLQNTWKRHATVNKLKSKGIEAENFGVDIEWTVDEGFTLILACEGIFGNLFQVVFVGKIQSYGD
ncbi:MAG: hypothetical protein N3D12_00190 [Candidatus Methanomethyliaceae archaeon]|nr:hypothetical protein [Candidatus Methanomethyliaceae archaeon]